MTALAISTAVASLSFTLVRERPFARAFPIGIGVAAVWAGGARGVAAALAGEGKRTLLVVTGKGAGGDDPYAERGVLRRSVPHWLRMPELRPLVVGFEEAAHHHGGGGALYIRLRRR